MTSNIEEALAKILIDVADSASDAKEFILSESPDVVHQLLAWHMTISILLSFVGLVMVLISIWILKGSHQIGKEIDVPYSKRYRATISHDEYGSLRPEYMTAVFFILIMGIIGLLIIVTNLDWLQILIAPKLYILEYARDLIK